MAEVLPLRQKVDGSICQLIQITKAAWTIAETFSSAILLLRARKAFALGFLCLRTKLPY
jgi:hypothetical protein